MSKKIAGENGLPKLISEIYDRMKQNEKIKEKSTWQNITMDI